MSEVADIISQLKNSVTLAAPAMKQVHNESIKNKRKKKERKNLYPFPPLFLREDTQDLLDCVALLI